MSRRPDPTTVTPNPNQIGGGFDLTVVLNVHDEADYLMRTLRSTEDAADFARALGQTVELLIVVDRPSPGVQELVEGYEASSFDELRVINVDHGSLGPSRAAGVAAARGEFVTLGDADDLVSFNAFAVALETARSEGQRVVVSPEFVFIFDRAYSINHYPGSNVVSPLLFLSANPFTSRILASRDLLLNSSFADVPIGPGYAYEDWHLNCNLLAKGARFVVAPETILFYRSRSGSLSSAAALLSTRQIPPSLLFEPAVFKSVVAASRQSEEGVAEPSALGGDSVATTKAFLGTARCREFLRVAGKCDPAIAEEHYASAHIQPMRDLPVSVGAAYLRLCEAVGDGASFTDVVFAPSSDDVGQRPGVCSTLTQPGWIGSEMRVLVIARRPEDLTPFTGLRASASGAATFVTINDQDVADDEAEALCLKLIQSTGAAARIHLGGSAFGHAFSTRFGVVLQDNTIVSSPPEMPTERVRLLPERIRNQAGAFRSAVRGRRRSLGSGAMVQSVTFRNMDLPLLRQRLRDRVTAAMIAIDRRGGWIAHAGRLMLGPVRSARATMQHRQIRTLRWSPRQGAWIHRWPEGRVADVRRWDEWRGWAMAGESYDFEELMFSYYRPGPGDVVVDVGAGHGGETFALANMVGPDGSVLAIEAAPDTYRRLEQLCRLNGWKQVETIQAAVSDKPGVVTISDGPEWVAVNIFESGITEVPAVTLDDLCLERGITRIDWLKMNIEGAEKEAIRGMEVIAPMIRNVTISCHDFLGTEWGRSKSEVVSWLVAHGFSVRGREYDPRTAAHDYVYAWR